MRNKINRKQLQKRKGADKREPEQDRKRSKIPEMGNPVILSIATKGSEAEGSSHESAA